MDIPNPDRAHRFANVTLPSWVFLHLLFAHGGLGVPTTARHHRACNNNRRKIVRRSYRSGQFSDPASRFIRDASFSSTYHGDAPAPAGKSITRIWAGSSVSHSASRYDEDIFAGFAFSSRSWIDLGVGIRVAFGALQCGSGNTAARLVHWICRVVHGFPVFVPSAIRRKNNALGDSCAGRAVTFLPRL